MSTQNNTETHCNICKDDMIMYAKHHSYDYYKYKKNDEVWVADFPYFRKATIRCVENGRVWLFGIHMYFSLADICSTKNEAITCLQDTLESMKDCDNCDNYCD